ncbi:MAG: hypothetical protein JO115_12270 [Pseudonocardiales bacterium]|nr:hypothetical protein [Pseudonocardiales bacterium]MBV9032263.1 hypothetical protein [Pseudonocardiales bacterium]MBV9141672.1 hypothetical protein [Pseudonocardiales bacterium]MBW0009022.1 hypothetical protein [Pseudonocardiales bacterium]
MSEDQRTVVGEGSSPADYEESLLVEGVDEPEVAQQYGVVFAIDDLFQMLWSVQWCIGENDTRWRSVSW